MRRDWRLIRKILLAVESATNSIDASTVDAELGKDAFSYHAYLLHDGGYINQPPNYGSIEGKLTNKGHDILDQLREEWALETALRRLDEAGLGHSSWWLLPMLERDTRRGNVKHEMTRLEDQAQELLDKAASLREKYRGL